MPRRRSKRSSQATTEAIPADLAAAHARFTQLQSTYATLNKQIEEGFNNVRVQVSAQLRQIEAEHEAKLKALSDRYAVVTNYTRPDKQWVRDRCWEKYASASNVPKDEVNMRAAVERYAASVHAQHRREYLARDGNMEEVIALMEAKARDLAEAGRHKAARKAYDLVDAMKGGSGGTQGAGTGEGSSPPVSTIGQE